jgi:hypothetical protein
MLASEMTPVVAEAPDWQVRVSSRATLARINRRLSSEAECLRQSRGTRARADFGEVFYLDLRRNVIVGHHVDVEAFARELGVLQPYERLDAAGNQPSV